MTEKYVFPLERALQARSASRSEVPNHRDDLYQRYLQVVGYLEEHVYKHIDAGLAALSEDNGVYTLHDAQHFEEVIKYAGELVECFDNNADTYDVFNAYELFVLLVAIRIHDAGNMYGRERHERRTEQILKEMGAAVFSDSTERVFIAEIARAHGGKTPTGSKDTISPLRPTASYGNVDFRPQLLAAIVRFADEICETSNRAATILMKSGALGKNEVFHKYASCISSVRVYPMDPAANRHSAAEIVLEFNLDKEDCYRTWGKTEDGKVIQVYLIEEIAGRLQKMARERQYCNRFVLKVRNIAQIRANVHVWDEQSDDFDIPARNVIFVDHFRSEADGYPTSKTAVGSSFTGLGLIAELDKVTK